MKKTIVSLLGVLVLTVGCVGTQTKVKRAVTASLAPETPRSVWTRTPRLDPSSSPEGNNTAIGKAMGTNNLTGWLLTSRSALSINPEVYDWQIPRTAGVGGSLAKYLSDNFTAVRCRDIKGLNWSGTSDDAISGSFRVQTSYGLQAAFVFHAKRDADAIEVDHLAIKKKCSSEISEGFTIFKK